MELDTLLLERLNIVNNIIPKFVKADVMFSIPLIIEYLETLSSNDKIDKDFSKTIKNFYLMDSGCIILDNYKEKRYWDIGNSIGLGLNKYYIGFDPSLNCVNLYKKNVNEYNLIDITKDDNKDDNYEEISKTAGLSRFENLKTTINNTNRTRLINVDKSQLPSIKFSQDGKIELDYLNIEPEPNKSVILNIMLSPFLMKKENIIILKEISQNLSDKS
jgi:hypothetical protein